MPESPDSLNCDSVGFGSSEESGNVDEFDVLDESDVLDEFVVMDVWDCVDATHALPTAPKQRAKMKLTKTLPMLLFIIFSPSV